MDDEFIRQLNLRIEEHQNYLRERLDDLSGAVRAIHAALADRLDAHEAYHRANEHRWGLVLLAARHPFRLALVAGILAWSLAAFQPHSRAGVEAIAKALASAFKGHW